MSRKTYSLSAAAIAVAGSLGFASFDGAEAFAQASDADVVAEDVVLNDEPVDLGEDAFEVVPMDAVADTEIEFVSDHERRNLRHRHVTRGIGVPVMIQRQRPANATQPEEHYADGLRPSDTAIPGFRTLQEHQTGQPPDKSIHAMAEQVSRIAGEGPQLW